MAGRIAKLTGALLAGGVMFAAPAQALTSPGEVTAAFTKASGSSDLKIIRNDGGAVVMAGHLGRLSLVVLLNSCKAGKDCELAVMQTKFALGRIAKPADYEAVSVYNSEHPFTSTYVLVEGGKAGLGISQGVALGPSIKFSADHVALFGRLMDDFAKFAGERKGL